MAEKIFIAQRDFSSGEVDANAKRRDDVDRVKAGARQMRNVRPRQTGALDVRPGRRAIAPAIGKRTELLRVSSAPDLYIEFSAGKVDIYDLTGALVATNTSASYLWTNTTLATIVWCVAENEIVMCYPGMQPQMAVWDGAAFTFQAYTFTVGFGVTQMPFFRFSVPGATMTYNSPATGSGVGLESSQPYFTVGMIGTTLSIIGQQCTITAVADSTHATVTVASRLPDGVTISVTSVAPFVVGQVAALATQTLKMEIQSIDSGGLTVSGVLLSAVALTGSYSADVLVSPLGTSDSSTVAAAATATTEQWQEQFMGALHGWPASCFFDNNRLGFCDFPQRPEAILWSGTGDYQNCWVDPLAAALQPDAGAKPNSAMLEFISAKPRVKYVVGWGDEFAFTDLGVYQIPISVNNPLKPGSVQFIPVGDGGCGHIHPMLGRDAILYVNAGLTRVSALLRTGSLTTPYILQDVTEFHGHLINNPVTLTISAGDGAYPERYAYLVNADGSVVVGKFTQDKQFVGWVPWSGPGTVQWMSAIGTRVLSNVLYGSIGLVELEDSSLYLDGVIAVNAVPTAMVKAGKGPCWPSASGTVTLMDGLLDMGEREVDADGNIVLISGDDLSSPTLVAGQIFQQTLEPFTPQAQNGPDVKQRQRRRRIARAMVTVQNGTAFTWGDRDIPAFLFNEPTDVAPPLRETTYSARTRGRDYDPRIILQKVRPGPLTVLEVGIEVTI
jgi:hypothetical protein